MEKICKICNQSNNSKYKDFCKKCYQKVWVKNMKPKLCLECGDQFKSSYKLCNHCYEKKRQKELRKLNCSICKRTNMVLVKINPLLCTKCDRNIRENQEPDRINKRQKYNREYCRKRKGKDLNAPIRKPKGFWIDQNGYVLMFKKGHPNATIKGIIKQHTLIMSEHIERPLKKNESVHHKNGIKTDNRIDNLELWHKGQPSGQRLSDKLDWAKKLLEEYGFKVIPN